jgi:hypothetical protein
MGECEHFVQFCESDEFLVHSVSGFIGSALNRGEAGIVVATRSHREQIERALVDLGLDLGAMEAEGRFVSLDAGDTLKRLCVNGWPDESLFRSVVGGLLTRMSSQGWRIRAFGEMVVLLVESGQRDAALRLEDLWNGMAKDHRFSLFCAYPVSADLDASALNAVCRHHSGVIPGESYSALDSAGDRMREIVRLQQKMLTLEAEVQKRTEIERAFLNRLRSVKA